MLFKKRYSQKEVDQKVLAAQIKTLDSILKICKPREDVDKEAILKTIDLIIEDCVLKLQAVDSDQDWRTVGIQLEI